MRREDLDQQLDAMIEEAMMLSVKEDAESFAREPEELPFELSDKHKAWMEDYLGRQKKARRISRRHHFSARAAAILLTAAIGGTVFIGSVDAAKEPVERFFTEVKTRYTSLVAIDDEPEKVGDDLVYHKIPDDLEDLYVLDYVPWGYKFEKLLVSKEAYQTEYLKDEEQVISLQQIKESKQHDIDGENAKTMQIIINGEKYFYAEKDERITISWFDGPYTLIFGTTLDQETAIKVVKNIKYREEVGP